MTISSLITRTPLAFDPEKGAEICAPLELPTGPLRDLVQGTAGTSPYLAGLIRREGAWLAEALHQDPNEVASALIAAVPQVEVKDLKPGLRALKRRVALWTALMDLGGIWPVLEVTGALTRFADASLDHTLQSLVRAEAARGKLPGVSDTCTNAGGMVMLAMGKMGAHELNYSSDIDLIALFDQDQSDPADFGELRAGFIKITRRAMGVMSDITGDGYVFRTDLRLRPDPSVTPVCVAMEAAERYYESVGRGWERAAHIKARPAAGDLTAGEGYLQRLSPFIWRKHLDFIALRDNDEMRQRIREHKGLLGAFSLPGHNIKLGAGGIREIEFFTQTHQMILGGRAPDLRLRGTVEALAALAGDGRVPEDTAQVLTEQYLAHRRVEHSIQMVNDAQTHDIPREAEGLKRLSYLLAEGDVDRFSADLEARLRQVTEVTEPFFAPPSQTRAPEPSSELSETARAVIERWKTYPALRSDRAVEIFERLRPGLLARLERAAKPEEALVQFDGFLSGLPAGVQLFALFEANPQLIDLIVDICATSPALARYLSRNSDVFDAVIAGPFFAPWPGPEALSQDLAVQMGAARDYEHGLDTLRRWQKEWHFRIGVHLLRGLVSGAEAAGQYADLADTVIRGALPWVQGDLRRRHGDLPEGQVAIVGMGSLGARGLTAASDLDLIVIYDAPEGGQSDGARSLDARSYYAKLAKTFVTALSAPMAEGIAYEVDMRLRPSGRQGPVATGLGAYRQYQEHEAWTWEHLALTRARPIAGDAELCQGVEQVRAAILAQAQDQKPGGGLDRAKVLTDWAEMRQRLFEAKPGQAAWDVKSGPGAMMDVELLGQAAALLVGDGARSTLDQLAQAGAAGLVPGEDIPDLQAHYARLTEVQHCARLLSDKVLEPDEIGAGGVAFLLRATKSEALDELQSALVAAQADMAQVIARATQKG